MPKILIVFLFLLKLQKRKMYNNRMRKKLIPEKILKIIEKAVNNLKNYNVSKPIDLKKYKEK